MKNVSPQLVKLFYLFFRLHALPLSLSFPPSFLLSIFVFLILLLSHLPLVFLYSPPRYLFISVCLSPPHPQALLCLHICLVSAEGSTAVSEREQLPGVSPWKVPEEISVICSPWCRRLQLCQAAFLPGRCLLRVTSANDLPCHASPSLL